MIRTAEHEHTGGPEGLVERYWPAQLAGHYIPPQGLDTKVTALAEINYGRWIVRCPWCPSAQMAFESDKRFFCVSCLNAKVSGKWINVAWPAPATRAAVEAVLEARFVGNRHWSPAESLAKLKAENITHGLPVKV